MKKLKKHIVRGQAGMTGIETAIILIACVVVASVFAFSVLSAGVFSSEKSKEAIFEGIDSVRSSLELVGGVVAYEGTTANYIGRIKFTLSNALNGAPVDFTNGGDTDQNGLLDDAGATHTTVITFIDSTERIDDIAWTTQQIGKGDNDALLEVGEKFQITVWTTTGLTAGSELGAGGNFTIEVKPASGATLTIERTLPSKIDTINDLR